MSGISLEFEKQNLHRSNKISLGICAMDKKSKSKPMSEILKRLPSDLFNVTIFGDDTLLNGQVEKWPICECLITFFSKNFPTDKVLDYVHLRQPYLINDLDVIDVLSDRRNVYRLLMDQGIDVPKHVFVERDDPSKQPPDIEEFDDYIVVNGVQINKPLVEKPVDSEDHSVYIYYPLSAGGGSKRLFRKVKDRSSEYYDVNDIRREGSYIYEEFLHTQGTDVKVYTVGPDYAHAEARKSPVVDGRVLRDSTGLEVRYPVILTHTEKEISRKITIAFRQYVCGFDILRVQGKPYVCDVNGWSFVKNSRKYYDDCSQLLADMMLSKLRPHFKIRPQRINSSARVKIDGRDSPRTSGGSGFLGPSSVNSISSIGSSDQLLKAKVDPHDDEELRSVIAVVRHGDRTPKQKLKLKVKEQHLLDYFHEFAASADKDLKVKSKPALIKFLNVTRAILSEFEEKLQTENTNDSTSNGDVTVFCIDKNTESDAAANMPTNFSDEDFTLIRKLKQVRDVLERREISGINRKLQMKPLKWNISLTPTNSNGESNGESEKDSITSSVTATEGATQVVTGDTTPPALKATQLLVILKWGGDLTPLGAQQAERTGARFRNEMYPSPTGGGILRLHATYRHDLKIKASDEGRVMKTAAAFAKGLLELEGQLTPILASLVTVEEKSRRMLDKGGNYVVKEAMDEVKGRINKELQVLHPLTVETQTSLVPASQSSVRAGLRRLGIPGTTLARMHALIGGICDQLETLVVEEEQQLCSEKHKEEKADSNDESEKSSMQKKTLYLSETFDLMCERWQKINKDFLDAKTQIYDLTKVPDVYDMIRYDVLHNQDLALDGMHELYELSMAFADTVVPQEYGIDEKEKLHIGSLLCGALARKILSDLDKAVTNSLEPGERGYMLDESHADDLQINSLGRIVRTRLYFTSESHLHSLLNVLRYPGADQFEVITPSGKEKVGRCPELSYLTQVVFRLFESKSNPDQFRVEISFSPGATGDPRSSRGDEVAPYVVLTKSISVEDMCKCLRHAADAADEHLVDEANENTEGDIGKTVQKDDSTGQIKLPRRPSTTVISSSKSASAQWEEVIRNEVSELIGRRNSKGKANMEGNFDATRQRGISHPVHMDVASSVQPEEQPSSL